MRPSRELGEVVSGADKRPFGPRFFDTAQQEPAEPSRLSICPNTGSTICFRNR